jgi:hypothetical protein
MTPVYMPFTYLPEFTARTLNRLVGPIVVYQPSKKIVPDSLSTLVSQGLVEIRTPIVHDDDRVSAALAEFTDWVRLNPGSSTPGAGFFSARQGEIPFYDETTINRIRSDIKRHDQSDHPADPSEAEFSARLFLAAAQENDRSADLLDHDLKQFKAQEKAFMDTIKDADDVTFNRESYGGTLWREDPGAKLTGQRIRAWSSLALADKMVPELLVTTSRPVMDTLLDVHGDTLNLERLAEIQLAVPSADAVPLLGRVLEDLATGDILPGADIAPFSALAAETASETAVTVTLFSAANHPPAAVIRRMAPAAAALPEEDGYPKSIRHTLFLLVES